MQSWRITVFTKNISLGLLFISNIRNVPEETVNLYINSTMYLK